MEIKPLNEIWEFLRKYADPLGIEIVDVVWDDRSAALDIFIDTPEGVDLNTCEKFHNAISDPIDELDPTYDNPYTLNVSSPGLDRPFKTDRDFERNMGKDVELKLFAPLKGKKRLEGVLCGYDGNTVTVNTAEGQLKLPLNKVAKINKAIKFE